MNIWIWWAWTIFYRVQIKIWIHRFRYVVDRHMLLCLTWIISVHENNVCECVLVCIVYIQSYFEVTKWKDNSIYAFIWAIILNVVDKTTHILLRIIMSISNHSNKNGSCYRTNIEATGQKLFIQIIFHSFQEQIITNNCIQYKYKNLFLYFSASFDNSKLASSIYSEIAAAVYSVTYRALYWFFINEFPSLFSSFKYFQGKAIFPQ